MKKSYVNIMLFILSFSLVLFTKKVFSYPESPSLMRGLRPLGMGNAFVAVSDDQNALFYNPAGLNDVSKSYIELVNLNLEFSYTVVTIIQDVVDVANEWGSATSEERSALISEKADENMGNPLSLRLNLSPGYTRKNFALKIFPEGKARIRIRDGIYPNLEYQGILDVGTAIGYAHDFKDQLIQVGVSLKPIYRLSTGFVELGAHDASSIADIITDFDRGFGVGVDLGFKSHLDVLANRLDNPKLTPIVNYLKPTAGFVVQDIWVPVSGDVEFPQLTLNLGTAVNLDWWKLKNTVALDFRDLNTGSPFINKICIGLESQLNRFVGARGGLYQFRPSFGGTFDFRIFKAEFAGYFEEVGTLTREKGDFKVALMFGFGW
jgi:hypothetical protein